MFADIGSITTSTQGMTMIKFKSEAQPMPNGTQEMMFNRGFNGGHMQIGNSNIFN